ncbi:tetratricopeptide repeat protein [Adhaeretor mobilis]|uniref:Tetratricopeptide repeat protein n=1 Tax=Adhaeretor mobilis TaxID=1930276 RepID=A0A517MQ20_9BACT|nr:hypothetical protein [Adhaeretor mobilis]QDS96983.1 hypothetical protein HG15A2_02420 [Adhaeretor mobilis]
MAKRRRSSRSGNSRRTTVRRDASGHGWILVPPKSVRERSEDLDEVRTMIEEGEPDIAIDELRWLLEGSSEMIEAHFLLGKLAVEVDNDLPLARGHFGFGYQIGMKALRAEKSPQPVPALHPANRTFFDAGRGLAWTLDALGKKEMALEVVEHLLYCDPNDPLNLGTWIDEIKTAGQQIVDVGSLFGPTS